MEKYAVVVGSMNCDTIYLQKRLPEKGETFFADSASVVPGGKGANQAVQISKLGMKTYMIAKIGNDNYGSFLKGELERYGVKTDHVMCGKGTTGLAAVLTMPDGVYYSTVAPGTNYEVEVAEIEARRDLIANASVAVFQSEITHQATERAIEIAHENGVYVVLNAAPAKPYSSECLSMVDCLIVNETEAEYYIGKKVSDPESAMLLGEILREKCGGTVVITLGKNGSVLLSENTKMHFEADQSVKPVETTGSGDSYVGAFAFMKASGCSDEEACEFASRCSQFTITKVGGQPSMPYLSDLDETETKIC
ncbi:MAG: ribokinase [Mogibacterium sp.]|nr:ribokinase [Mogibacterium sp.]